MCLSYLIFCISHFEFQFGKSIRSSNNQPHTLPSTFLAFSQCVACCIVFACRFLSYSYVSWMFLLVCVCILEFRRLFIKLQNRTCNICQSAIVNIITSEWYIRHVSIIFIYCICVNKYMQNRMEWNKNQVGIYIKIKMALVVYEMRFFTTSQNFKFELNRLNSFDVRRYIHYLFYFYFRECSERYSQTCTWITPNV